MSPPTQTISLQVTVYISPEDVPAFFEHFKPVFALVTAENACTFFQLYQSQEDKGTISWVENWTGVTKEWLVENQIPKDYYKPYFAATERMFIKPREFKILDVVGPEYTYQSS